MLIVSGAEMRYVSTVLGASVRYVSTCSRLSIYWIGKSFQQTIRALKELFYDTGFPGQRTGPNIDTGYPGQRAASALSQNGNLG